MSDLFKDMPFINKGNSPYLYLFTALLESSGCSKKKSQNKKCFHEKFYNNDQQPNKKGSSGAKIGS